MLLLVILVSGCRTMIAPHPIPAFGGWVVSARNAWRGTFTPDGRSFYFFRPRGSGADDGHDYEIVRSDMRRGRWTTPVAVELGVHASNLYPAISPDGRRLVFTSYRPAPGRPSAKPQATLWYVQRIGDGWSEPVFMDRVNATGFYHSQPSFDAKGHLYFRRSTANPSVTWVTHWDGREFVDPVPFEPANRWSGWQPGLLVWGGTPTPDGKAIVFEISSLDDRQKPGPSDLWIAQKTGDQWLAPRRVSCGVNTGANENFAFFSPDGRWLYFVRDFRQFLKIRMRDIVSRVDGKAVTAE